MLYIESKRLGRSTVIGLLSITFVILLQGLFGALKMVEFNDDLSDSLVLFSDTQLEALTLKGMLINLRKLEKDILLHNQSPTDLQRVNNRWKTALVKTEQQFALMEIELRESHVRGSVSIFELKNSFRSYSEGINTVVQAMLQQQGMRQKTARLAMAQFKKHIYSMEYQIDIIVEAAEAQEINSLLQLEENKRELFWMLGLFGLVSILISILLSSWIVRKNMHISRSLEYQALHDSLTGLMNRRGLAIAMQNSPSGGVIAYLDLDHFKLINDLCGHSTGDELLIKLSNKLQLSCRQFGCTLARVGGDEFIVWLSAAEDLERAQEIAKQLVSLVEEHQFEWMGQSMKLGVSIGLALGKGNFLATELISRADAACRSAKIPGNAKVSIYEESDPNLLELRRQDRWAAKIPSMIINSNFCLFGQKIIALQSASAAGHIEVLVRGLDKNGEIIAPELFLPAAERFGLMPKIDRWVIETLLSYNLGNKLQFSINLSAHTLADKAYLPELITLITASGKASQLIFEITESAAMSSIETAQEYISSLKAIGCKFSLDDFGSGFSSFSYLRDLDVDFLKIDGSLIKVLGQKDSDAALVQAIVSMAAALGLKTIGEYVETPQIAEILHKMKVDYAQGFKLHKPEPLEQLTCCSTDSLASVSATADSPPVLSHKAASGAL